jgi:hypothetical protein
MSGQTLANKTLNGSQELLHQKEDKWKWTLEQAKTHNEL